MDTPQDGEHAEPEQSELTFEERVAASPIHQWSNVEERLVSLDVPSHVRPTFHEFVFARGRYPARATPQQIKLFGQDATRIAEECNLDPTEVWLLRGLLMGLLSQWYAHEQSKARREN